MRAIAAIRVLFAAGALMAALAGAGAARAKTVAIDFNGLPGADGTPFNTYREYGFNVIPVRASGWLNGQIGGNPAPFIYIQAPGSARIRGTIRVQRHGDTFSFTSVDLYSSVTHIPYVFRGYLKGAVVFTLRGKHPHTFGAFATVKNRDATATIDALEITLTDPGNSFNNPMGLDNIRLAETRAGQH